MWLLILTLVAQTEMTPMHCGTPVFSRLRSTEEIRLPGPGKPANPPSLGETRLLWLQNMTVMPPVQFQTNATCRGTGIHCYVMVEDSAWDAGVMDSAGVARIIDRFDNTSPRDSLHGVWHHNTTVLGEPPDEIDNDSLIYLVYYNIGSFHGYQFDGFWQHFDEYYDTTAMRLWGYHSNEIECVYLDCHPNDPTTDYRIAIAAHEFGHMIQWNYDRSESLWVEEGNCELAMWLFGAPDAISGFPSSPDNDLTRWTGSWADYIKTYLWSLFLYEQYGEHGANDLIHNIIASPQVSIAGINEGFDSTGLAVRFEEAFDHWVLTNRINDTTILDGRYGYYGENVPFFSVAGYHTSYPVSRNGSLNRWAGEYLLFENGTYLELEFDGADAADFRLYLVALDTAQGRILLDTIPLDSLQYGTVTVPGFDSTYRQVYLIPANHTTAGQMSYWYGAAVTGIAEPGPAFPRPATRPATVIRAGTPLQLPGHVRIISPDGRLVLETENPAGTAQLKTGIYFAVSDADPDVNYRLVVIR